MSIKKKSKPANLAPAKPRTKEISKEFVAEKSANGLEWKFANTVERMPIGTKLYAITPQVSDSPSPNPEN